MFGRLLGLFLLIAAGLKLSGLHFGIIPEVQWLSVPRVQLAAAQWELVLGVWLISGTFRGGTWVASILTFGAFAFVSGSLGWVGVTDCGCFGVIKASPWVTFGIDAGIMVVLAFTRPDLSFARGGIRQFGPVAASIAMLSGILVITLAAAVVRYGSIGAATAELRDNRVSAPEYVDFGTCTPLVSYDGAVAIRNLTNHPIRLVGGTSDCSCLTTDGMPIEIPSDGQENVTVSLRLPLTASGTFTRLVKIWIDDEGTQRTVRFRIGCRVEPPSTPAN